MQHTELSYKPKDYKVSDKALLRYIPKEYKPEVVDIWRDEVEWNELTKRYNQLIGVEWSDGTIAIYQNARYMFAKLREFGSD